MQGTASLSVGSVQGLPLLEADPGHPREPACIRVVGPGVRVPAASTGGPGQARPRLLCAVGCLPRTSPAREGSGFVVPVILEQTLLRYTARSVFWALGSVQWLGRGRPSVIPGTAARQAAGCQLSPV